MAREKGKGLSAELIVPTTLPGARHLKQTHTKDAGQAPKKNSPKPAAEFQQHVLFPEVKASLSTSHGCGQGDVVVLICFDANLLLCRDKGGSGQVGSCWHSPPRAEPGTGTYKELLLAFGVPLQDGVEQLGRLAGQREPWGQAQG